MEIMRKLAFCELRAAAAAATWGLLIICFWQERLLRTEVFQCRGRARLSPARGLWT